MRFFPGATSLLKGATFIDFWFLKNFLRIFDFHFLWLCIKESNYLIFKRGLRLFKGLCLLFLPNVPGAMFIQGGTFIPDSRVSLLNNCTYFLLVSSGWYFLMFAVFSEMDNMSHTFLELRPRPRALFNRLIIQGFFFPSTWVTEKTPSKTEQKKFNIMFNISNSKFKTYREQ